MIEWIDKHGPCDFSYDLHIEILTDRTPATWVKKLI